MASRPCFADLADIVASTFDSKSMGIAELGTSLIDYYRFNHLKIPYCMLHVE